MLFNKNKLLQEQLYQKPRDLLTLEIEDFSFVDIYALQF